MPETVVFLGAGASKPLGLPMTAEIFPKMLQRLLGKDPEGKRLFNGDTEDSGRLLACLHALLPGLAGFTARSRDVATWKDDLLPITDVLSTIDYLLLTSNSPAPGLSLSELERARKLIERAIFELLVRNESPDSLGMADIPDVVRKEWDQTSELKPFEERPRDQKDERKRVVDWLMQLTAEPNHRVTIISTNYDIELEQALYARLTYNVFDQVDFGLSVREIASGTVYPRPPGAKFALFKLHGSLNWLRCSVCDNVYVNPAGAIAYLSFLLGDGAERRTAQLPWLAERERDGANECHCGARPLRHVIVAPSLVRDIRDPVLQGIWRNALESLRRAEKWIIAGYSLPPEDVSIRSMLLRAYQARDTGGPEVIVVQQEEKEPELTRYQLLFKQFRYVCGGLKGYLAGGTGRLFPPPLAALTDR